MAEKSFEFDTSKIVAGSISADKIVTGQQWDNYPTEPGGPDAEVSDENVWENYDGIVGPNTKAMLQYLNEYNRHMSEYLTKMLSEPRPPPDHSWVTFREERR